MAPALLAAVALFSAASVARAAGTVQTEAKCQDQFGWMANSQGQSPCLIAAYVLAQCQPFNSWDVVAITPGRTYSAPGRPARVRTFFLRVPGLSLLFSTYYPPPPFIFPSGTSIPFWATKNPTQWDNGQFDVQAAQSEDAQGHPDLTSVPVHGKTSNAGAIAGGVVAAIVILIAGVLAALFVFRRRQQKRSNARMSYAPPQSETSGSRWERTTILNIGSSPSPPLPNGTPIPLPSMMTGTDLYSETSAAPSSGMGIYAVNPLILPPTSPTSTQRGHGHTGSGDTTNSTVVPMSIERYSKMGAQHGRNGSSSSLGSHAAHVAYRPGQFNPPPYSAVATHNGTDAPMSPQPTVADLTSPAQERDELSPLSPTGLQVANPRDHRASDSTILSAYPHEKGGFRH
ncbi:hypothetical protein AURDEDRAFT_118304 [Auricularia subglabra TFB-10046 SS5]|nr:hypothetical protein AURDEDRAFT_118304 [Auricularia subglabra TFB-10046 SS5]